MQPEVAAILPKCSTCSCNLGIFSHDILPIKDVDSTKYLFIECGHMWMIPNNELNRMFSGRLNIIYADGSVDVHSTEDDDV